MATDTTRRDTERYAAMRAALKAAIVAETPNKARRERRSRMRVQTPR